MRDFSVFNQILVSLFVGFKCVSELTLNPTYVEHCK